MTETPLPDVSVEKPVEEKAPVSPFKEIHK